MLHDLRNNSPVLPLHLDRGVICLSSFVKLRTVFTLGVFKTKAIHLLFFPFAPSSD